MNTPVIEGTTTLHAGKWLHLKGLGVTHPDGRSSVYEVVSRNQERVSGVVSILPVTKHNEIIMIEQYRIPVGRTMLELPAGCQEPTKHKTLEEVVHAELREETGYRADSLSYVAEFASSAGMTDETSYAFIAHGCEKVTDTLDLDSHEYITPVIIPLVNFDRFILDELAHGRLMDAKSLALIWYYRTFCLQK